MERPLTTFSLIETLALIAISLKGGEMLALYLKGGVFELPIFVCVLFVGVLLRNLLTLLNWHEVSDREVSLLGNVSLSLFLAMALMSLRLWELASLALPIFILLAVQTVAMALYERAAGGEARGQVIDLALYEPMLRSSEASAVVFVERKSQKGIVIGKGGASLKRIKQGTIRRLKAFLGVKKVELEIFVKVVDDWRNKDERVRDLGIGVEEA